MKKKIIRWQIAGFVFTALTGMLLHMLYNWTGQTILVAPFCAVNESIWEHMKLLFFPMLLFAIIQYKPLSALTHGYWSAKFISIATGTGLIPIMFYTYQGISGKSPEWFNIVIYFAAIGVAFLIDARRLLNAYSYIHVSPYLAIILLCLIAALFVVFTFVQPQIPLFQDPSTGLYGMD